MEMFRTYTDYVNKTALTLPDKFIDVRTGESIEVLPKVLEQIEYHSNNSTLIHLVLTALNSYLQPKSINNGNSILLEEIREIKRMMQMGYLPRGNGQMGNGPTQINETSNLDLIEVEDVLEAFGG